MEREDLLTILFFSLGGSLAWLSGLLRTRHRSGEGSPRGLLADATWDLAVPMIPAVAVTAALLGWVTREPDMLEDSCRPGAIWVALAALTGAVWLRAIVRAAWSAVVVPDARAYTRGLISPRVVIDSRLAAELDDSALESVRLHEEAHARSRDPLRIFLASFVTDLSWPLPGGRVRLRNFLHALEIARDDDARGLGADGLALADAIVTCALLGAKSKCDRSLAPGLIDPRETAAVAERMRRLLAPRTSDPARTDRRWAELGASVIAALAFGVFFGHGFVRLLLGL